MGTLAARIDGIFPSAGEIPSARDPGRTASERRLLVGGEIRTWDGPSIAMESPLLVRDAAGGLARRALGDVPLATADVAKEALDAAARAFDRGWGAWPTMRVRERIEATERFADAMAARRDEVARLLCWEIGKSWTDSGKEFDRTVEYVRETVRALKDLDRTSSRFSLEKGVAAQIRRSPLGVCLCMGPYNYPLNETFTTLLPALIMGNTAVLKTPKWGALCNLPLLEAFRDAFPPGVVNVISGEGPVIVPPILEDGRVDVLAFIGSTGVANRLKKSHPKPNRLRSVLGLGAKNPAIVLADADLDRAVPEIVTGALSFNGQRCTGLKMIFVHRKIAEVFVARLAAAVDALPLGVAWRDGVFLTPLPFGETDRIGKFIGDATAKGAKIANECGGRANGTYLHPAVVYPAAPGMSLWHEEQFGPVVPVAPFDEIGEVLDWITASPFGQQASVFGRDPAVLGPLVDGLVNQVSRVNLNAQCQRGPDAYPFTGRKDSAEGTLSVTDALRVFSIRSMVASNAAETLSSILAARSSRFLSTDFLF